MKWRGESIEEEEKEGENEGRGRRRRREKYNLLEGMSQLLAC